ncbi:MAG: ABC transporter permease [Bacteroidales bacterium]|nr:ABC transporter permease [Bacteroidales bacterium]
MDAAFFIARKLRLKGQMAMICITVSFLVMIIAVAVSSGFRREIRSGISSISGDIMISTPDLNVLNESRSIDASPAYISRIEEMDYIQEIVPVVYRAGIVKTDDNMHGVLLKGVPEGVSPDSVALAVSIPSRLAEQSGLKLGDRMTTYFVGDRMQVRQFIVADIYESLVETDDSHVVYASISDLQRLNGWDGEQVSAIEIILDKGSSEELISSVTDEVGTLINAYSSEDDAAVMATSSVSRFHQLFSWLDLIDFNVFFILLLMTIVAGFNMISGLLIILFENISTIGLLKSLGMTDRSIAKSFLASASVIVLKGMAAGNALGMLFCLIQGTTHFSSLTLRIIMCPLCPFMRISVLFYPPI